MVAPFNVLCTDFYQVSMVTAYIHCHKAHYQAGFELFYRSVSPHVVPHDNESDKAEEKEGQRGRRYYVLDGVEEARRFVEECREQLLARPVEFVDAFVELIQGKLRAMHGEEEGWVAEKIVGEVREFFRGQLQIDAVEDKRGLEFSYSFLPSGCSLPPHVPAFQYQGPLWLGQLLETPLTCILNGRTGLRTVRERLQGGLRVNDAVLEPVGKGGEGRRVLDMLEVLVEGTAEGALEEWAYGEFVKEIEKRCGDVMMAAGMKKGEEVEGEIRGQKRVKVMEAGFRRAPSLRAARVCSCVAVNAGWDGTSNVGVLMDNISTTMARASNIGTSSVVPVERVGGTMSHAWVMSFTSEAEAFELWDRVFPGSTILVDTYNVQEALELLVEMRKAGMIRTPANLRIDSDPLKEYAVSVRKFLDTTDEGKWENVELYLSGDVGPELLEEIQKENVPCDMTMVGSKLVNGGVGKYVNTGFVYKLVEISDGQSKVHFPVKKATGKRNQPGLKQMTFDETHNTLVVDCQPRREERTDRPQYGYLCEGAIASVTCGRSDGVSRQEGAHPSPLIMNDHTNVRFVNKHYDL
eukprot:Nk52_evm23s1837 gene=Nk52_evmTU23s1837